MSKELKSWSLVLLYGGIQYAVSLLFKIFFFFGSLYAINNSDSFYENGWLILASVIATIALFFTSMIIPIIGAVTGNNDGMNYGVFAALQWILNMVGAVPYTTMIMRDNIYT